MDIGVKQLEREPDHLSAPTPELKLHTAAFLLPYDTLWRGN
jgi:hypothetical protein